ncbi:Nramp family divalent metal transporter [Candidatus Roizmanbacteria bacterium]|nr:Nramp family divalent metal transporter [Candidatus Roizmanbacteria bacterium]
MGTSQSSRVFSDLERVITVKASDSFWKKVLLYMGPGFLVAVGYVDPGNWATDLAAGSTFGYTLLFVIFISNLFALLLQYLAAKLGIASGQNLAQICRARFPRRVNIFLWILAEIMIIACDTAEVVGSAIGINLLFHIPILLAIGITIGDVLLLLLLQRRGFRYLEAFVISLIGIIIVCFALELFFSQPQLSAILYGLIPTTEIFKNQQLLYLGIGILGATVMPHNLYLHSALVQTRTYGDTYEAKKEALKFSTIDSFAALTIALLVNMSILILSAATFHVKGVGQIVELGQAYQLLAPLLGTVVASTVFAIALIAAGQSSTVTATLAGQIVMEGFVNLQLPPWIRRLGVRILAITPALLAVLIFGENALGNLLILTQVILSLQLSFAVFPLIFFTSSKKVMGRFANSLPVRIAAIITGTIIAALNLWLVITVL